MTNDEVKREIEQRAGIPGSLLNGETAEEIIQSAHKLLDYKINAEKEAGAQRKKNTRDLFADWLDAQEGIVPPQDERAAALTEIEEMTKKVVSIYPDVKDAGEANLPYKKSTREQFADWIDELFSV